MKYSEIINYFVALLVICTPWSAFPIHLNLMHGRPLSEKRHVGIISAAAVAVILIVITWIGDLLLSFLGIRIPSFQVAGGFVLLLLALSMLRAETSPIKQTTEEQEAIPHKHSIAVVPLAIPIIAGPGAISTVIVAANNFPGFANHIYLSLCAILVAAICGFFLFFGTKIEKILGPSGINILSRISGLILAALAVELLAKGIAGLFPHLMG